VQVELFDLARYAYFAFELIFVTAGLEEVDVTIFCSDTNLGHSTQGRIVRDRLEG